MKQWINQIDQTTEAFQEYFGGLSPEALNWKPNPNTWSIAQNIEHLIVINGTYFPLLAELKSGRYQPPFVAKIGFLVSFFGKTVLNASKPDRKKKIKTFPIWEPTNSKIKGDILERFVAHQTELKDAIGSSDALIKNGAIIASPANKNIVYKLETAFDIIVVHEQRHLEQAKEVLGLLPELNKQ